MVAENQKCSILVSAGYSLFVFRKDSQFCNNSLQQAGVLGQGASHSPYGVSHSLQGFNYSTKEIRLPIMFDQTFGQQLNNSILILHLYKFNQIQIK